MECDSMHTEHKKKHAFGLHCVLFPYGYKWLLLPTWTIFTLGNHRRRRVLSSVIASVCPSVCPSVRPERHYRSDSLRISVISLKFVGMMHSTTEQIVVPFCACSTEFKIFHDRLFWPGLWDDVTILTLSGLQVSAWNLVGRCTVTCSRLQCKVAMLGWMLRVPWNFFPWKFSMIGLDQVGGTTLPLKLFKYLSCWTDICCDDAQ